KELTKIIGDLQSCRCLFDSALDYWRKLYTNCMHVSRPILVLSQSARLQSDQMSQKRSCKPAAPIGLREKHGFCCSAEEPLLVIFRQEIRLIPDQRDAVLVCFLGELKRAVRPPHQPLRAEGIVDSPDQRQQFPMRRPLCSQSIKGRDLNFHVREPGQGA